MSLPTPALFFQRATKNNNNNSTNGKNANLKKSDSKTLLQSNNPTLRQNDQESLPSLQSGKFRKPHTDNRDTNTATNTPSPSSSASSVATMVNNNISTSSNQSTLSVHKSSVSDSSTSSAPEKPAKLKKQLFKNFGKKAALIAGDIAFGSAYTRPDEEAQRRANEYYRAFQAQRQAARLEQQKLIESADIMDKFIDELRFYLKFAQESEFDDSLNYANARKDIWNDTYRNFLVNVRNQLKDIEANIDNPDYFAKVLMKEKHNKEESSSKAALPQLKKDSYLKDHNHTSFAQRSAAAKQKTLANLNELTSPIPSPSSSTSSSSVAAATTTAPGNENNRIAQSKMLHQRQLLLIMSWMSELTQKLLGHPSPLLPKTKAAIQKITANIDSDPSKKIDPAEICTIIGSHNFESELEYSNDNKLNFLQGWNLRFKEPDYYINSVCIASNMQTIYDADKHGFLKEEDFDKYPNFYDSVLEKMEKKDNTFLGKNEQMFLSKYSFFTTTSATKIPLSNNSQAAVHCIDFTSLVSNEELGGCFDEIYRILKPKGAAQFIVRDIAVLNTPDEKPTGTEMADMEPDEFVAHKIWMEVGQKAQKLGYDPQLTSIIVPALYKAGFSKVSYNIIAYPQLSSLQEEALPDSLSADSMGNLLSTDYSPRQERRKASIAVASKHSTVSLSTHPGNRTDSIASSLVSEHNNSNQHSGGSPHPAKVIGYKDNRANDFFELYSNFMEFKTFFKFTGLNVKKMIGDNFNKKDKLKEEIEFVKLFIDYKFNGSKGELVKRKYLSKKQQTQTQTQTQTQFLSVPESSESLQSPTSSGFPPSIPVSPSNTLNSSASGSGSSFRNEGVAYILVIIAEK